jgi:6-oxocyclohex-1-ene-1-carbonyl-CoA hydrolase
MSVEGIQKVAASEHEAKDHSLISREVWLSANKGVRYEKRPVKGEDGKPVAGLYNAWITLDNPTQFNSYTTDMVKSVILAFREASVARDIVAVVFTGTGEKAFCTGGNTKEYAEYYAGNPQEYRGYMRLFNDMVSAILGCDKPVVCRVNGIRVGGGQEIGMACDFSIAQDLARFGQRSARPRPATRLKAGRNCSSVAPSISRCSTRRSKACAASCFTPSPTAPRRRCSNCASPSSTPGTATRRIRAIGSGST